MTKNQEKKSPTNVLEVPEKVGFGSRDSYLCTEALENRITYAKNGKGDQDIIWVIEDIKKRDPQAKVQRDDGKIVVKLSQPFDVRTYKAPRKVVDLSERQKKRLQGVLYAIAEAEMDKEDYKDEDVEQKKAELPKIIPYYTEDETENYYAKSESELWIEEDFFKNNSSLLLTLTEAYLKSKGLERGTIEYQEKFEAIVAYYV